VRGWGNCCSFNWHVQNIEYLNNLDKWNALTLSYRDLWSTTPALSVYGWLQKKNGNCQKKFCQILLNFYSLKRPFRI
jgi:hypothetical protein